ncbi:MAG TPA: hypothetical protein VMW91_00580 [Desulfosporosinus sp.]|nr:hypothetical protein [Desulfosporosinus sp.]
MTINTNATNTPLLKTDGQLMIGGTGVLPASSTITAGDGMTVINGPNTITLSSQQNLVQQVYAEKKGLFTMTNVDLVSYDAGPYFFPTGEGEIMNVSITPTSINNFLLIQATVQMGLEISGNRVIGLFKNGSANSFFPAIATAGSLTSRDILAPITFNFRIPVENTDTRTYNICGSTAVSGIIYINGNKVGLDMYGGTALSSLLVTEIAASPVPSPSFWIQVNGTNITMSANQGYVPSNAGTTTLTLPTAPVFGDIIDIVGQGSGGSGNWEIAQGALQRIHIDGATTSVGAGSKVSSTSSHDSCQILCTVGGANSEFVVRSYPSGTLTVS